MNHGRRSTMHLDRRQATSLLAAAVRSIDLGCPPNWHVILHLERAKVEHSRGHVFLGRFLKQYGDWFRAATKGRPVYLYVFEVSPGHGFHVHILLYAPGQDGRRIETRCRKWLKAAGGWNQNGVVMVIKVRGSDSPGSILHLSNLRNLVRYFLKGADPKLCRELGCLHEFQGIVIGKRAGCSQSLGAKISSKVRLVELFEKFE